MLSPQTLKPAGSPAPASPPRPHLGPSGVRFSGEHWALVPPRLGSAGSTRLLTEHPALAHAAHADRSVTRLLHGGATSAWNPPRRVTGAQDARMYAPSAKRPVRVCGRGKPRGLCKRAAHVLHSPCHTEKNGRQEPQFLRLNPKRRRDQTLMFSWKTQPLMDKEIRPRGTSSGSHSLEGRASGLT